MLGGGTPLYKEAYRMPPFINQGVRGVYLLQEMKFNLISQLKVSLHWGWPSSGITCVTMFAAFPSTIMEAAFGRLHNGGPANIANACGNRYPILADLYILPISPYSPVMAPGAIQLAKSAALLNPIRIRVSGIRNPYGDLC